MALPMVEHAARARAVFYFAITLVFTLLMAVVTIRFAFGGGEDLFETALLAILTLLLAFQTRRWFRRFRNPPPAE